MTTRILDPDTGGITFDRTLVADAGPLDPDVLLEVRRPASYRGMSSYVGQLPVPTVRFRPQALTVLDPPSLARPLT